MKLISTTWGFPLTPTLSHRERGPSVPANIAA